MIHPEKALNTGQLYEWQEENDKELFKHFIKPKISTHEIVWEYLQWKYDNLGRNQKRMKELLNLEHFFACKDGKPLEKPKEKNYIQIVNAVSGKVKTFREVRFRRNLKEYQQAEQKVLFAGYKYEGDTENGSLWYKWDSGWSVVKIDMDMMVEQFIQTNPKITKNYFKDIFNFLSSKDKA